MAHYDLICQEPGCGKRYAGQRAYRLVCDQETSGQHGPALLKAIYPQQEISLNRDLPGIFKFSDWLPTQNFYFSSEDQPLSHHARHRTTDRIPGIRAPFEPAPQTNSPAQLGRDLLQDDQVRVQIHQ